MKDRRIGKIALLLAFSSLKGQSDFLEEVRDEGFRFCLGRVGSMDLKEVVAAIETATRREGLIKETYHQQHALYHAILEALVGVSRGEMQLGGLLRTAGLNFSVVLGESYREGQWVAVALYGMMGAPIKGHEHEVVGLGINHIG